MSNSMITKRAICSAFEELLEEKSLGKITVKDISSRCGITRNTFYYHYQDILDLLEDICQDSVDHIIEQYPSINSIDECADAIAEYVLSKKRSVMHIYNSNNRSSYVNSLWKVCDHVITTYADTAFTGSSLSETDRALLIQYYKCSAYGIVIGWIRTGMKADDIAGIRRILRLQEGLPELVLANAAIYSDTEAQEAPEGNVTSDQ